MWKKKKSENEPSDDGSFSPKILSQSIPLQMLLFFNKIDPIVETVETESSMKQIVSGSTKVYIYIYSSFRRS